MQVFRAVNFISMVVAYVTPIDTRSDVYVMTVRQLEGMSLEDLSTFKTEFMVLKIKLRKGWITVVGVY